MMTPKRSVSLLVCVWVLLSLFLLGGCSSQQQSSQNSVSGGKPIIVATLFPQYDFAREIVGDKAEVMLLMPPGVESHSYEPTPKDILTLEKADLILYTGSAMEPWAQRVLDSIDNTEVEILDVSTGITLVEDSKDGHEEDQDAEDLHTQPYNPHIWTSPKNAIKMVINIQQAISQVDPENASLYQENASQYLAELTKLDETFRQIVQNGTSRELYFGSRFAMLYFVQEYGLDAISAYDSCSTETEPSAGAIASMITAIKEKSIPVIYYQELTEPKIARSISEATGAQMLLMHSCHNLSKEEFGSGVTYLDLMKQNAENLGKGLGG